MVSIKILYFFIFSLITIVSNIEFFSDEFLKQEKLNFEKGKRHLANMMGMDHNTMTQKDIDVTS